MGSVLRLKNSFSAFFLSVLCVSCGHDEVKDKEPIDTGEVSVDGTFVLKGSVHAMKLHNEFAVFRVQLVNGDVTKETSTDDFVYPEAQVLAVGNAQSFEFNGLAEGVYTLIVSRQGYVEVRERIRMGDISVYYRGICMYPATMASMDNLRVLDEAGNEINRIELIPYATSSVGFYLHNGTEGSISYNMRFYMTSGYSERSFIVNGKLESIHTDWVKDISQESGILPPNTIQPIEVLIDPNVYLVNVHSTCILSVDYANIIELSF